MTVQSICFISKSTEGMGAFDTFPPEVKRLFYETEQNICAYCAMNIVSGWVSDDPRQAPLQVWIEVIRQMETGEIRDNPFTRAGSYPYLGAAIDYRGGPWYEREFTYQRPRRSSQDFNPRDDRTLAANGPDPIFSIQQAYRYRDGGPSARPRSLQNPERNWARSMGASFEQAIDAKYEEILRNSERTR